MKKIVALVLASLLVLSMTSAFAATGLGSITTVTVTAPTAEKAGSVTVYTTMCALTLDEEGKIVGVDFDAVQSKAATDADLATETQSKDELKEAYGMKAISPIGLEYYEQMNALEAWCIGKTVEEVLAGAAAEDADLKAGCTVGIADQLAALQEAAANAK